MNINCSIVKDLLPLYEEHLVSEETSSFIEEHLDNCTDCNAFYNDLKSELSVPDIKNDMNNEKEKMFKKINRRLSIYQIIFVAIAFATAMYTSLLNKQFGFILWYTVLGLLTYLFYKDLKIVFLLSFIPIFLWSLGSAFVPFFNGQYGSCSFVSYLYSNVKLSIQTAFIHFIFAFIGGLMGILIYKIKEK